MIVRQTGDRPAPTLPWLKVSEVTVQASSPLRAWCSYQGEWTVKDPLWPPLRAECTMTIYPLLSVLPTKQEKQQVQSAMSLGWSAVKWHSLSSPLPCSQGEFHCSAQGPQVGREEYLLENPSVWWVSTELRNWIAKTVTFSMSCSWHCLSFLYFERTHATPIEGRRGTKPIIVTYTILICQESRQGACCL